MKNLFKLLIAALVSISMAPAASAGTFSPTGTVTATATVQVRKLLTLSCVLNATIQSNGSITSSPTTTGTFVTNLTLAPGDSNCANIAFSNFNWPVTSVSATVVRFHNVQVTGITGNCFGTLDATLSGGNIIFTHANTIPATSGIGNCSLAGTAPTSPTASYTFP